MDARRCCSLVLQAQRVSYALESLETCECAAIWF